MMRMTGIARSAARISLAVLLVLLAVIVFLRIAVTQPTFGELEQQLPFNADPARLRQHVEFLCEDVFPRNSDHPGNLDRAASYIAREFTEHGARVEEQVFAARGNSYRNVIAEFGPAGGDTLIVGAHYDVFGDLPGADDNASGVAVLLELGRMLGASPPSRRIELVAYTLEEPPFFGSPQMGSAVHARSLIDSNRSVLGMISIEMVGYFAPDQRWDNLLLAATRQ